MHGERLDLTRTSRPASDRAIEIAADEILALLRDFESPKDAGSALMLAHLKMIQASFPPEFRREAIESVDGHAKCLKELLAIDWQ